MWPCSDSTICFGVGNNHIYWIFHLKDLFCNFTTTRQDNTSYTEIHWPSWTKQFHHVMICGMEPSFTSVQLNCSPVQVHLYSRPRRFPGLSRSLVWSNCATHKIYLCDSLNYTPWAVITSLSRGRLQLWRIAGHKMSDTHSNEWPFECLALLCNL